MNFSTAIYSIFMREEITNRHLTEVCFMGSIAATDMFL